MSKLVSENDIKDENWIDLPSHLEKKIEEQPDPHRNNASVFTLHKEDHTIANLLRMKLHTNKQVRFAGYKIPHPTVSDVELAVQTALVAAPGSTAAAAATATDSSSSSRSSQEVLSTPAEAVLKALDDCIVDVDQFSQLWESNIAPHCLKKQN